MKPSVSLLRSCSLGLGLALFSSFAHPQGTLYVFGDTPDAVDAAGDVDLDGHPDFLVSRAAGASSNGLVRVLSGATGALIAAHGGPQSGTGFGAAIAGGADLDLDGKLDFVVGAPLGPQPYVRAVRSSSSSWVCLSTQGSRFGSALDLGGDVDGDGVADVIVGAPDKGAQLEGGAFLLSGANGFVLRHHAGSAPAIGEFGRAVVFLEDITGDGIADYAVGDPRKDLQAPGDVTVYSGASGAVVRTISGNGGNDAFGFSLAQVGDVDGDGRVELAVGAPEEFLAFKRTGTVSLVSPLSGAVLHKVFARAGSEMFGSSVAGLEDYDGDGSPDFAGHYPVQWVNGGAKNLGTARILSGATGLDLGEISLGMLGPIAAAGDVNVDGVPDLLVAGGQTPPGFSALFLGRCEPPEFYCTAKTSSQGCVPESSWGGASSASVGPDFRSIATRVPGQTPAILVWSNSPAALPFAGGWLCVGTPIKRSAALVSHGPAQGCDGRLDYTFTKTYLAGNGQGPGAPIYAQFWLRDPGFAGANAVGLTRGTRFIVWP